MSYCNKFSSFQCIFTRMQWLTIRSKAQIYDRRIVFRINKLFDSQGDVTFTRFLKFLQRLQTYCSSVVWPLSEYKLAAYVYSASIYIRHCILLYLHAYVSLVSVVNVYLRASVCACVCARKHKMHYFTPSFIVLQVYMCNILIYLKWCSVFLPQLSLLFVFDSQSLSITRNMWWCYFEKAFY